jgi:hypothetical protein
MSFKGSSLWSLGKLCGQSVSINRDLHVGIHISQCCHILDIAQVNGGAKKTYLRGEMRGSANWGFLSELVCI